MSLVGQHTGTIQLLLLGMVLAVLLIPNPVFADCNCQVEYTYEGPAEQIDGSVLMTSCTGFFGHTFANDGTQSIDILFGFLIQDVIDPNKSCSFTYPLTFGNTSWPTQPFFSAYFEYATDSSIVLDEICPTFNTTRSGAPDPDGIVGSGLSYTVTCQAEAASSVTPSSTVRAVELPDPLGRRALNLQKYIGTLVAAVLGILGAVTLLVFVVGAFTWITSAGYPQRVQKGTQTMLFAVAGLFVIFAAYAILSAFIQALISG